jgi:hypothetical protein
LKPTKPALVDRCVFEDETVTIRGLSDLAASGLVARLRSLAKRTVD